MRVSYLYSYYFKLVSVVSESIYIVYYLIYPVLYRLCSLYCTYRLYSLHCTYRLYSLYCTVPPLFQIHHVFTQRQLKELSRKVLEVVVLRFKTGTTGIEMDLALPGDDLVCSVVVTLLCLYTVNIFSLNTLCTKAG